MSKKGKSLIIVESPAKIKTLSKFLGKDYLIESSIGHVRDLPEKGFGIDIDQDFEPTYEVLSDKKDVIKTLISAAKKCDTVYLSPDPDREGEAIAWHIAQELPEGTITKRATFNAITKDAVLEALNNPRTIDQNLVDAQQARRLLDRIVGYKISPLLNRRVGRGKEGAVSAGRVQSVALKLVVDREKEIDAFNPVEYWNIGAIFELGSKETFAASLFSIGGKKVERELVEGKEVSLVDNQQVAGDAVEKLKESDFSITRVDKKEKRRNPVPPFITSTLQQEASRYYSFSASRTMKAAQRLYEGIDLGNDGPEGLITYMRTDSVRIEPEALATAREYIKNEYGQDYLPEKARVFSTKKSAQDAHEAVRPTNLAYSPEVLKDQLERDQYLLYCLIWKRFLASQMMPAIYDTVSADVTADCGMLLRATGSTIKFRGFLIVYEEKTDDETARADDSKILPELSIDQPLTLDEVSSEQAFTRPPPRFSEASLVKELEKSGVGRPSTYATIMNKIQSRAYTEKESNRLVPTDLGKVIAQMLEKSFPNIMDTAFTSGMEDDLERVAGGEQDWKQLLRDFWADFGPAVDRAEDELFVPKLETDLDCPKCKKKLQKIWSKSRYFYGCSAYPECDYTTTDDEIKFDKADYLETFDWEQKCPQCEGETMLRHGRYGPFLGCLKYPDCKGIINIPKKGEIFIPHEDMPECPAIGCDGRMTSRKSRFGKTFYSCSTFPDCNVIVNALEQLPEKYQNYERKAYEKKVRKKAGAKGKKGAAKKEKKKPTKPRNMPPVDLTPALAEIVGATEMPRTQVTKKVWEYIKANNLQDEKDKRIINPDEKLAKVFGNSEPMQMFQMTKVLSQNMKKKET